MTKRTIILFLLLFFLSLNAFAEDPYIILFDRVLTIEDKINQGVSDSLLAEIEALNKEISESPFTDLQTRMRVINNLVKEINSPVDLEIGIQNEIENLKNGSKIKTFNTLTIISGSITIASLGMLTTSLILSEIAHDQMTSSDLMGLPDQVAYFYKLRSGMDKLSLISGGVCLVGIITTSTLIALRPPAYEFSTKEIITIDPALSGAVSLNDQFQLLAVKRQDLINQIKTKQEKRKELKPWLDFSLYTAIGSFSAMSVFLALGLDAYTKYHNSYDQDVINNMRDWSEVCNGLTIGFGVLGVAGITTHLILSNQTSTSDLIQELQNTDISILNFPF